VADIYGAREDPEVRAAVCAGDVVDRVRALGGTCEHVGAVKAMPDRVLAHRKDEDVVLVLGAGDIDTAVEHLVASI
ncbi:MAG: hypothetical protein AAFY46_10515, partial [Planctomycetota bacterium]